MFSQSFSAQYTRCASCAFVWIVRADSHLHIVRIASLAASSAGGKNEQVGGGTVVAQLLVGVDRLSKRHVLVGGNCSRYGTGDGAKFR